MTKFSSFFLTHKFLFPLLTFITFLSTRHFFHPGFPHGHDNLWHVQRILLLFNELKKGHFPVRWVTNVDNDYGLPLFNYLYPLPYYFASLFLFVGFSSVTAFKYTLIFFYLLGGWGMYLLFSRRPWIAFTTALIYLFTPYQFVNLFVRGAFGETVFLGLAPWVFLSLQSLSHSSRLRWYHPLPLALVLLSHNFLGLVLLGLVFLYTLIFRLPTFAYLSLLLSFLLAAFFLLPMFLERNYLLSATQNNFSFKFSDHFIYPRQLLYSKWGYWYSLPGTDHDGMTFQLGFANIVGIILTCLLILILKPSLSVIKELFFFFLTFIFFVFLTTPYSFFLWHLFPLLQVVQFPWRFLAFTTLLSSLLIGWLFIVLHQQRPSFTFILSFFFIFLALFNTRHYHRPMRFLTSSEFQDLYQLYANKTTTSLRSELVPKWAPQERFSPSDPNLLAPRLAKYQGGLHLLQIHSQKDSLIFTAKAENNHTSLRLYRNYFPSWQATRDGHRISLFPSPSGEIIVPLTQGQHTYHVWVGQTNLEKLANLISFLALTYIIYLLIKQYRYS